MENNDFQNAITLRDQIGIACEYLRTKSNNISFNQIALFFSEKQSNNMETISKVEKREKGKSRKTVNSKRRTISIFCSICAISIF